MIDKNYSFIKNYWCLITIPKEKVTTTQKNLKTLAEDYQLFFNEKNFLLTISSIGSLSYLQPILDHLDELGLIELNDGGRYIDYVLHKIKYLSGIEPIGKSSICPHWLTEKAMNK